MKKLLLLVLICISFIYAESQNWSQVPGYQTSYGDILGVTRHQGNIWVLTSNRIYKIIGSNWEITSSDFSVVTGIGCIYSDGADLYAGSLFNIGSSLVLVIKWNGAQWIPIGYTDNVGGVWVATIFKSSTGKIYAGGSFNNIGTTPGTLSNIRFLVSFDGTTWTQPYPFTDLSCTAGIYSIQPIGDSIYVAGLLSEVSNIWTPSTFRFKEGAGMSSLDGYGFCQLARDYCYFQNQTYVGGTRQHDNINVLVGLTKRSSNLWVSVSSQMQLIDTKVTKLLGKMYVAGTPGGGLNGVPTNIVSYDGTIFLNEGAGISSPNGSVYPSINCIFADTIENKLYVGGSFLQSNGNVADNFAVRSFSIVPIQLSSFNAKLNASKQVLISWRDETPSDQNHYEVQMSTDGRNFYKIGSVKGNNYLKDYSFPYNPTVCGDYYFRLTFENKYSGIRSVELPCTGPKITAGKQLLTIDTKTPGTLILVNPSGQVLSRTVLASGYSKIQLITPAGICIAHFVDKNGAIFNQKVFIR